MQHLFTIKALSNTGIDKNILNLIKDIYKIKKTPIKVMKDLSVFYYDKEASYNHFSYNKASDLLVNEIRQTGIHKLFVWRWYDLTHREHLLLMN